MKVNNPYLKDKRSLILKYDADPTPENKKALEDKEIESRDWVQAKLEELHDGKYKIEEKIKEIEREIPSINQQHKAVVRLHRDSMELTKELSELRKSLYLEIQEQRASKKKGGK